MMLFNKVKENSQHELLLNYSQMWIYAPVPAVGLYYLLMDVKKVANRASLYLAVLFVEGRLSVLICGCKQEIGSLEP